MPAGERGIAQTSPVRFTAQSMKARARCNQRATRIAPVAIAGLLCGLGPFQPIRSAAYAIGADLSFLKQAEDQGTVFKDAGQAKPGLQIFKDHGYKFPQEVSRLVLSTPNNRGIGIFWWEPAVTGGLRARGMFGDDGNALPVIHWSPDATPLKQQHAGRWQTPLALEPGRHQYKFVADGQWLHDPLARENVSNGHGSLNSVVEV